MPKVDVLLATYNGEKYISEQIKSLLNQSFKDFRIIIRDDGSTDDTVSIVKEFVNKYPDKIELIEDSYRSGSSKNNFFILIQNASSDFVMFCDQDDVWLHNKIESTLNEAFTIEKEKGKSTPVLVFSDYTIVDEKLKPIPFKESHNQISAYKLDLSHLLVQNYVTGCLTLVNRALYSQIKKNDNRIMMHDWWIALYASAFGIIKHINVNTMQYRQHGDNCVGATDVKSFKYRIKKIKDPNTKNSIDSYYHQAQAFLDQYGTDLENKEKQIIETFLDIPNHSKLKRIIMLMNGKYLKSDFVRIVGQLFYI